METLRSVRCSIPAKVSKVFGSIGLFGSDFAESYAAQIRMMRNKEINLGPIICYSEGLYTIPIYCSDEAVLLGGMPSRRPGIITGTDGGGNDFIVANQKMFEEPDWFFEACVAHEIGHIVLHGENKHPLINGFLQIIGKSTAEFEADEYAMWTTNMLWALEHMKELGYEVDARIHNLKRCVDNMSNWTHMSIN